MRFLRRHRNQDRILRNAVSQTTAPATRLIPGQHPVGAPKARRRPRRPRAGTIAGMAAVAIGLLLVAAWWPATAKVFLRWSRGDASAILKGHQEGKTLYQSTGRMNGIRGHARVAHHDTDFDALRAELIAWKQTGTFETSGTLWRIGAHHILGTPDSRQNGERVLYFNVPGQDGVLSIRFQPTDQRPAPAGGVLPEGMPTYPGAAIRWSMELDQSRLAVYAAVAHSHAATVASSFDRSLRNDGWQDALGMPPNAPAKPSASRVYLKNGAMLIFGTRSQQGPGGSATHLTVIHKQR